MSDRLLHENLSALKEIHGENYFKEQAPEVIYNNIRQDYGKRPYQQEAFGRFKFYWEDFSNKPDDKAIKLLYHMATGSGKTLIMAGLMVYLYQKGYRNFLFFVDKTNIIDKTRENFLNPTSSKYLFAENLQIGDKQINVREVDNFSAANQDEINIVFTTIGGLHSKLKTPRENSITFEDFEDQKTVLISDEAHHINALTKSRPTKKERENKSTWEGTVRRIVESHPNNVMLEFTATMDLEHERVREKYKKRIIFDYPLKKFRLDGYSKEVKVLRSDMRPIDRAIQAVILSQYRLKIFNDYGISKKPIIMFKANYVNPPTTRDGRNTIVSSEFRENFQKTIQSLDADKLKNLKKGDVAPIVKKAFSYFEENDISLENLALELEEDFSNEKCISIDSKNESEENQILINSLEDNDNPIRAVFAVDKLNEGWDVLNLFDIVRLYDKKGTSRTTMQEAQLIGRGARYCPFQLNDEQPKFKRKYDVRGDEEEHELKICEELYYHSYNKPDYITQLNKALREVGIKPETSVEKKLSVKDSFKQTDLFQSGKIFVNERKKYKREDVEKLDENITNSQIKISFPTGYSRSTAIFEEDKIRASFTKEITKVQFAVINNQIIRKALQRLDFYHFKNLKKFFPNLSTLSEFITSDDYLSQLEVEVAGPKYIIEELQPDDKLYLVVEALDQISSKIKSINVDYKGSKEFKPKALNKIITDKILNIARDEGSESEYGIGQTETTDQDLYLDLKDMDWYAFNDNYGTSEEKRFVKYIYQAYEALADKYTEVYLVRNEKHFKIYNFDNGQAFEPDFVLFLIGNENPDVHYQIFIEPKGDHLIKNDEWKERFLLRLKEEHELDQLWKGKDYIIWGMPFYNENNRNRKFEEEFNKVLE